jgi:hypothetical protein
MAAHSVGTRVIPPVPPDQPPNGDRQWLRDIAQSINLASSWAGTEPLAAGGGGTGNGTVTSVTAGTGLAGTPNPIVGAGTLALSVPVTVANGGTGSTTPSGGLANLGGIGGNQTITLAGAVTGTGATAITTALAANAVTTAAIAAAAVTYAKIQNVATSRLLGNPTGSAAAPSEISLGTGLSFAGNVLNVTAGGSGTVTSVTAGTGLTASPNPITGSGTLALSVPVSIANGGTGATTVAATPWVQKAGDTMSGSLTVGGFLYSSVIRTGLTTSGVGQVGFGGGTASFPGYIEWFLPNGTRQGYFGANNSNLYLGLEQGHLRVAGVGNAGIELNNAGLTANLTMFNDNNGHISSTAGLFLNWIGNQGITAGGSFDIYGTGKLNIHSTLFAEADGPNIGYNKLYSPAGNIAQYIGAADTQITYYRQTGHKFQDIAGTFEIAMFDTSGTYNRSGAWVVFSEAELKEDIVPFERGLDAVAALRPVTFRYRKGMPFADPEGGKPLLGLLAHQVEEHIPEIVGEAPVYRRGMVKTLAPGNLVYPIINALREIKQRLEILEARFG